MDVGRFLREGTRSRRVLLAAVIYVVCLVTYAWVAGSERLSEHTPFNHFAHLADAWLHGRQDLRFGPPGYAQGNDFAVFNGKTYISFPPFPAVLMVPFVGIAGSPEAFRDGQFMVWLAGVGPAVLFLVFEKLRRTGRSERSEGENVLLAILFAFGTVYFFTAVEGTVWFAAHVVAAGILACYALVSLDAQRPWLAGLLVGCAFMTRATTALTAVFFAFEALRVSTTPGFPVTGSWSERVAQTWERLDKRRFVRLCAEFALPIVAILALASWMNYSRFGNPSPSAFGHEHLTVVWQGRIAKWGLFGYHYLSKNLGVMLTVMPWLPPKGAPANSPLFQINEHGLALWFTTPLYFWLLWPKRKGYLHFALIVTASLPLIMNLLYQNSGWRQFGYRFSNDYSVFLFMLLAVGGRSFGSLFHTAAVWSVAWNLFGAVTFDRGAPHDRYYWREGTQQILYQGD